MHLSFIKEVKVLKDIIILFSESGSWCHSHKIHMQCIKVTTINFNLSTTYYKVMTDEFDLNEGQI